MKKHRCFLAMLPPEQLHQQLFDHSIRLQSCYPDLSVKWTRPEQFHLTLQFFGNLSEEQIEKLDDRLSQSGSSTQWQISAEITLIALFPNPESARVIAAIITPCDELQQLHNQCQLPEQKPQRYFRPHITLARCKKRQRQQLINPIPVKLHFSGDKINLIESELTSQGPVYSLLGTYPL